MNYLPTKQFLKLATDIAALEPCPFAGRVTADQIMVVLVEAGVAPANTADDCYEGVSGVDVDRAVARADTTLWDRLGSILPPTERPAFKRVVLDLDNGGVVEHYS